MIGRLVASRPGPVCKLFAGAWLAFVCAVSSLSPVYASESPSVSAQVPRLASPADPLEPLNRGVAQFNNVLDRWLVRPIAQGYDRFTPEVLRMIIGNVLSNLLDPYIALNNLLQGKPAAAMSDIGRFALNTSLGFLGFGDPASDLGYVKHREDFGQTLGVWGVPSGPYLVLPFFGPSTLRDGAGFGVDAWAALINRFDHVPVRNTLGGLEFIETRARFLPAQRLLDDALDPYLLVRDGYLQRRRNQVWDGNPPEENGGEPLFDLTRRDD